MKHKHCKLIKAWVDGAEIEYFNIECQQWFKAFSPRWNEDSEYRIKPVKLEQIVIKYRIALHKGDGKYFIFHWSTNDYPIVEKHYGFVKWLTDEQIVNIQE